MKSQPTHDTVSEVKKDGVPQPGWDAITKTMRRNFAQNLTAALDVAGEDFTGTTTAKLPHEALRKKTGIARSTISKLTRGVTKSGMEANPDLDTICRLAWALNIPPFFLLMTQEDWSKLASAFRTINIIIDDNDLRESLNTTIGTDKVIAGLDLAERLNIYPTQPLAGYDAEAPSDLQDEMREDIDRRNQRAKLSILCATAISQYSARESNRLMLTAIGAIYGASMPD